MYSYLRDKVQGENDAIEQRVDLELSLVDSGHHRIRAAWPEAANRRLVGGCVRRSGCGGARVRICVRIEQDLFRLAPDYASQHPGEVLIFLRETHVRQDLVGRVSQPHRVNIA